MFTIVYYMRDSRQNRHDHFHYHIHWQLELILHGKTAFYEEEGKMNLGPGNFVLIPPFCSHRFEYKDECTFYSIKLECKKQTAIKQTYTKGSKDTDVLLEALYGLFKDRETLPQSDYKICAPVIEAFINSVLPNMITNSTIMEKAVKYIDTNILHYITIADLCEHIQCSASSLNSKFQATFCLTPKQYIDRIRTSLAISYLRHSKFTIAEIAEKMNFADVYTFNRFCKRNTKLTPGQIQKTSNSIEYKDINFSISK